LNFQNESSAIFLGLGFAWLAFRLGPEVTNEAARQLFFASITNLPMILVLLLLDKP